MFGNARKIVSDIEDFFIGVYTVTGLILWLIKMYFCLVVYAIETDGKGSTTVLL